MSDIYVRPYDSGKRGSNRGLLIAMLLAFLLGGVLWWWSSRRIEEPKQPDTPVTVESAVANAMEGKTAEEIVKQAPSVRQPAQIDINKRFARAQSLIASGKLTEGSQLLDEVISMTPDANLKNSALRMQGRANMDLFLSDIPTDQKKSYVIQPGDSLDRIARKNNTTVALLRRMNGIKGTLIYPGARLLVPVAPFVIEVDKSNRTMDLMINGTRLKRYSVGLGRHGKTPLGTFQTVVHQTNPDWSPPSGGIVPFGDPLNVLGTRWISFLDANRPELKGFGIHGTADRTSIGGETSNGCIRMLNEDVEEVFLLIPRGTQVVISE